MSSDGGITRVVVFGRCVDGRTGKSAVIKKETVVAKYLSLDDTYRAISFHFSGFEFFIWKGQKIRNAKKLNGK